MYQAPVAANIAGVKPGLFNPPNPNATGMNFNNPAAATGMNFNNRPVSN